MSHAEAASTNVEPLLDGRYRIHEVLGRGATGVVHLATDERLSREVAIKILDQTGDPSLRCRFEREVRAVAAVAHPGLVPVFDVGETPDGAPYVVMERLRGETLEARIARDGPLSAAAALDVGIDIGEALAAAHAAGLVHRDVKPANIMLALQPHGRSAARLLDFGLATLGRPSPLQDDKLTADGVVVGSPAYVAPERLRGATADLRVDMYALGLVVYEALTGTPAFEAQNVVALRAKILTWDPPPLGAVRDDLPAGTAEALARAISKVPSARFGSMGELVDALRLARSLLSTPSVERRFSNESLEPPISHTRDIAPTPSAPKAPVATLPPNTTIGGNYRLVRPIGSGGMSVVYEATDSALARKVAVKLARGGVDIDRLAFARLEREARAAASLGHTNVVGVYDVGIDPHHGAFLIMELLNGESLLSRIRRKATIPVADAINIILQVLDGLAVAHAAGMIHRDIKPANVFLVPLASGGHLAKVLDFGIVKLREERESPKLTHRGAAIGTPAYMPPEQRQMQLVDARADVYAVGATFYEMLTGNLPPRSETVSMTAPVVHAADVDLSAIPQDGVRNVLVRAMAKDPAARYPHAGAMRDALVQVKPGARPTAFAITDRPPPPTQQRVPENAPTLMAAVAPVPEPASKRGLVYTAAPEAAARTTPVSSSSSPTLRFALADDRKRIAAIVVGSALVIGLAATFGAIAAGSASSSDGRDAPALPRPSRPPEAATAAPSRPAAAPLPAHVAAPPPVAAEAVTPEAVVPGAITPTTPVEPSAPVVTRESHPVTGRREHARRGGVAVTEAEEPATPSASPEPAEPDDTSLPGIMNPFE